VNSATATDSTPLATGDNAVEENVDVIVWMAASGPGGPTGPFRWQRRTGAVIIRPDDESTPIMTGDTGPPPTRPSAARHAGSASSLRCRCQFSSRRPRSSAGFGASAYRAQSLVTAALAGETPS
jgi:hypothetical protein